jgi:hypothetical protein
MVDEGWGRKVVDYCLPGLSCYPGFRPVESSEHGQVDLASFLEVKTKIRRPLDPDEGATGRSLHLSLTARWHDRGCASDAAGGFAASRR